MTRSICFAAFLALASLGRAGWLPEERLTERPDRSDRTCLNNARAAAFDPAGNLHVVWAGDSGGRPQAWYSHRDAAGGVWSPHELISDGASGARYPCLASDDEGGVHVAWSTADSSAVQYRRRAPTGSWGFLETIPAGDTCFAPSLGCGRDDSVFVAWSSGPPSGIQDVFMAARGASGWGEAVRLSRQVSGHRCTKPALVASAQGEVAVVWQVYSGSPPIICFRLREDAGWSRVDTLALDYKCREPSLFLDSQGVVHSAWLRELPGGSRWALVYRQRRDGAWGDTAQLPQFERNPGPGSVSVDGTGSVHVVFVADPGLASSQLFHIRGDSLGRNWSDPYRLTDAVGKRENPTLCLRPDDELAVVWTDSRYSQDSLDVFVRRTGAVRDVAVTALFAPDTVDSARDVRISVVVSNQGEVAEDFVTWLLMPDGWMDSVVVSGLGPGGSDTFEFGGWTAHARGRQVPACSIPVLPYDTCAANNVLRGEFFVRVVDVAVESLAAPEFARVLDTVRLNAMLYNPGNVAVEGWCRFEVADSLAGLVFLDSLRFLLPAGARAETAVSFVPAAKGRYRARAAVCAEGDMRPENDTGSCRFEVYEPEVRISGIVSPGPVVDSTDRVIPVVRVRNNSAEPVTCLLRLRIGERYADSSAVDSLSPGEAKDIEFGRWTAEARGEQAIACSLYLFPDTLPADVSRGATFVVVRDVVVDSVLAPRGEMRAGEPVAVVFQARNAGTDTARFDAFCRVEGEDTTLFSASQPVTLIPGLSEPVRFEVGRLAPGRYAARCSLYLEGEMRPDDDTAGTAFSLHEGDLWLTAIVAPGEEVDSGPPVVPRLGVRNTGEQPAGFEAFFGIGDGYAEAVQVPALQPGRDTVLGFPVWFPHQRGTHTLGCSLIALPDSVVVGPLTGSTFVVVRDAAAAAFVMPGETIPAGPVVPAVRFSNLGNDEGRAVGRLWAAGYEDSTDFVLRVGRDTLVRFAAWDAAPGRYELVAVVRFPGDMRPENDTCRFALVVDSLLTRSWQRLADLPAGAPARPVRRGARLVATGPGLFGLRASGTSDWLRYDPEGDSWLALARLPGERAARDGSAVCAGPGDDLFLIKGRGGREFLAYRSETNRWDQLESLPQGLRPVRYGTGMACVAGDTDKVYLATGGGRLGFLVYLVGPGRWHARRPVPPGPQGRGCRHGTDLVAARGRLFLLKGGSSEFYEYLPARDSWSARAGLPPAAPGRHRRTRAGAALAADGDTGVYALSGRGNEFWRYDLDADAWTRLEDVSLGDDRRRVGRGAGPGDPCR